MEVASRQRSQPAPDWAVFEDLCDPHRQPARPWLELHDDEIEPTVLECVRPTVVVWSSLWTARPDARLRFDLAARDDRGTDLRWTLFLDAPVPEDDAVRMMRHRIGELINANLRYTYGQ
ncbi:hypothetical protein [Mycobacterium sp. C31M]